MDQSCLGSEPRAGLYFYPSLLFSHVSHMCEIWYRTESRSTFPFQSLTVKSTASWVDAICAPFERARVSAKSRLKIITGQRATRTQLERRQQSSQSANDRRNDFPRGWNGVGCAQTSARRVWSVLIELIKQMHEHNFQRWKLNCAFCARSRCRKSFRTAVSSLP